MSLERRLSDLEDSVLGPHQSGTDAEPGSLYTLGDFEAEDDPVELMRMFNTMEERWHLLEFRHGEALKGVGEGDLRAAIEAGWIDVSKVSDEDLDLLAEGRSFEEVLGTEWQSEYGWSHLNSP